MSPELLRAHLVTLTGSELGRRRCLLGGVFDACLSDFPPTSVANDVDRHPERRMKAAFTAFEEVNLPRLKQENPNMRLSQLKQLLKKEWMKSPENPMNQRHKAYNSQK